MKGTNKMNALSVLKGAGMRLGGGIRSGAVLRLTPKTYSKRRFRYTPQANRHQQRKKKEKILNTFKKRRKEEERRRLSKEKRENDGQGGLLRVECSTERGTVPREEKNRRSM